MKKKLLTVSSVLLLLLMLVFSASAVEIKEFKTNSTFTPVTYSGHKSTDSITLYGNADYLCMKAYSETKNNEYFCIDIYSDSKRTKKILEYVNTFKKGTTYEDIFFDLTSLKSRTYYATSYVIKQSQIIAYGNNYKQDPATIRHFKIIVKRDGTSIKNMKCFMYGYENTYYGPAVYWYSVPGATKYYVYKYVDKQYKKIATVNANGENFNYYVDKSLKGKNTSAYYKVKAVNGTGSTALSLNNVKVITLKTPTVKTELLTNGIKVSWSKPKASCTYILLRSQNGGNWEEVKETKSLSYTDKDVTSGNTYYYTVVAYNNTAVSGYHPTGAERLYIATPTLKSVEPTDNNLVVTWNSVEGAQSYNVYKKAAEATSWTKVANVTSASYTDADVQPNKFYTYTVRAVIGKKTSLYKTNGISGAILDTPVLNEVERTEDGYAKITWNKIDGVSYKVYRKTAGEGWKQIKTTTSTEYIDKSSLINGKEYIYTVKSYVGSVNGTYDATGKSFIYMKSLENLGPYGSAQGIGLEWSEVENAEEYNVYRKTAETEYELLGTTQNLYYEDITAQTDVPYTYKVAYVMGTEEKINYAAETPAKLLSSCVNASELSAELESDNNWRIYFSNELTDSVCFVYKKTDSGLKFVRKQDVRKVLYLLADSESAVNEYFIRYVDSQGNMSSFSDSGLVLDKQALPVVTITPDYQNYAMKLTWTAVQEAEKYDIYHQNKFIYSVDGSVTTYEHTNLKPGQYHKYKVIAVKGNLSYVPDEVSECLYIKPVVKVEHYNDNDIRLSWNTSGVVSGYNIYRREKGSSKWKLIVEDNHSNGYIDQTVKNGKTYQYKVAVYDRAEKKVKTYGDPSVEITSVSPTTITKATYYTSALQIEWKESAVADYYEVYRKVSGGSWKLIYKTKNGKTVKYKDKDVKSGTKYQYSVKVVKDGTRSPAAKITRTFIAPPSKLTAKKVDGGIKISFSKVNGAQYYYVYRKGSDGKWTNIGKVKSSATSYTDKTAKRGITYSYYVKAHYDKVIYSYKSSTVSCKR